MFWYFLWSNISRKQTRQYRKSTKEATSGKDTPRSALPILPSTPYLPANVAYRIGIRSVDGDPETWFSIYFQKIVVKIRLPPGLCPAPCWGAYSTPRPLAEKGWSWPPCWKIVPAPLCLTYCCCCAFRIFYALAYIKPYVLPGAPSLGKSWICDWYGPYRCLESVWFCSRSSIGTNQLAVKKTCRRFRCHSLSKPAKSTLPIDISHFLINYQSDRWYNHRQKCYYY